MKRTNRLLSSFLAVSVVLMSLLVPMASADGEGAANCTVENGGKGFVRIIPTDTSFEANTARSFSFNVPATGDYAVFFKHTATTNDYKVSFQSGDSAAVEYNTEGNASHDGYKYAYVRLNAAVGTSGSVSLTQGACTISVTAVNADTIEYIDIRSTVIPVDGGKLGIYPSDYNWYSSVGYMGHINGEIQGGYDKAAGYTYYDDYNSSALTTKRTNVPKIHVNGGVQTIYKLNVQKAGTYLLTVDQQFYSYNASKDESKTNKTGTLTVALDDTKALEQAGEIVVKGNGGTSDWTTRGMLSATLTLSEGDHQLSYAMTGLGSYLYGITLEEVVTHEDKVVPVDNNLTRIELEQDGQTIAAGASRDVTFTVPVDGAYIFAANHPSSFKGNLTVALKNNSTLENTAVFSGSWEDGQNNKYARFGNKDTAAVALKKDVSYTLSVSPSTTAMTVPYIDVLNTEVEVSGKTVIQANYAAASNMDLSHLNCDDCVTSSVPEDYTPAGDNKSSKLASPSTTGILVHTYLNNKNNYAAYTLNVKQPGFYQITVAAGHWEEKETMSGKLFFSVNGVEFGSGDYSATNSNKNADVVSPVVYLYSGLQTLTVTNKEGNGCGMYAKYLLAKPMENDHCAPSFSALPVVLNANNLYQIEGGTASANGIALNANQLVRWAFTVPSITADLSFAGTFPSNGQVIYELANGESTYSGEATLGGLNKIIQNVSLNGECSLLIRAVQDGIVVKELTLTECKEAVSVPSGQTRTLSDLTCGALLSGSSSGSISAKSGTLNSLSKYSIKYNITDAGYYTLYLPSTIKQNGFSVYHNGTDVTEPWYRDKSSQSVERENVSQVKRVVRPTWLEAGEHEFVLEINDGFTATLSGQIELRRTDGPLYANASDGERIIPAYDFVSSTVTTTGWYFVQQCTQGAVLNGAKGYEDFAIRNVVLDSKSGNQGWTYSVNVPEAGYYDFAIYHSAAGSKVRVSIDGGTEAEYAPQAPESGVAKTALDTVYFPQGGNHTVTIMKESVEGALRLNALSFTKSNAVVIDTVGKTAEVSLGLENAVSGTVIAAFYKGLELVGVQNTTVENAKDVSVRNISLTDTPDSAKVMIWVDLENCAPLTSAKSFTTASDEWIVKQ